MHKILYNREHRTTQYTHISNVLPLLSVLLVFDLGQFRDPLQTASVGGVKANFFFCLTIRFNIIYFKSFQF